MILFEDIFNRAVNLFDDPDILRAYEKASRDDVLFSHDALPFCVYVWILSLLIEVLRVRSLIGFLLKGLSSKLKSLKKFSS